MMLSHQTWNVPVGMRRSSLEDVKQKVTWKNIIDLELHEKKPFDNIINSIVELTY